MERVPAVVLTAIDPILRDTALMCLLGDIPDAVALRYDMVHDEDLTARRLTMTASGVVEDVVVHLNHVCPTCGVNEDVASAAATAIDTTGARCAIIAVPIGAPSHSTSKVLAAADRIRLAAVVSACDTDRFLVDLLGDDLLSERDLHLFEGDERAVGQALATQVCHADIVLTAQRYPQSVGSELLDHVRAPDSHRVDAFTGVDLSRIVDHEHHVDDARRRMDPLCSLDVPPRGTSHVWSLTLTSDRPFHPQRLRENLATLALSNTYNRGYFWLPTRPFTACAWEGVGGQLSIGTIRDWGNDSPTTRLTFTGTDPGARNDLIEAFDASLLTAAEALAGPGSWMDLVDDYDPWLGPRSSDGKG